MRPTLSVVIPTTHTWPEVELPIKSIWSQIQALGAELIIVHRGDGVPEEHNYPGLVALCVPGATVFAMRRHGVERARGEIIALTEDHVQVAPDYCAKIIVAHAEHRDALALGGVVANGSLDVVGWASYFMSNINALPPERGRWRAPLTGAANLTFKRSVVDVHGPQALQQPKVRKALTRSGQAFNDASFRVLHIQSLGVIGSSKHHFHDGRQVGANQRRNLPAVRWLAELAKDAFPLRPAIVVGRVLTRVARQHPSLRAQLASSAPMIGLLAVAHCLGELTGLVAGVGRSAHHIP